MKPILLFPDPSPADVVRAVDLAGVESVSVDGSEPLVKTATTEEWSGAVVSSDTDLEAALAFCRTLRATGDTQIPILLVVSGKDLDSLGDRTDLFTDFCLSPFHPREFDARLDHLLKRGPIATAGSSVIEYGTLALNTDSYQAMIGGVPLELTYMEYELLRFLAAQPGRVFSRETLLAEVWGYDYFGGARTVDVHVRRLRAKFGDENADLIQTVRSVGYSFGQADWANARAAKS